MSRKEDWQRKILNPVIQKQSEIPRRYTTLSDEEVEVVYGPEDLKDWDYDKKLGYPGEYPYTRGIHPNLYRGKPWTMRLFAGYGTAKQTNERFRKLLEKGQHGLSVAFDTATIMGYDSDNPRSRGEVGVTGVAVDSLRDMEILFQGIPLDKVTTSMTINSPAIVVLAMYFVAAEKQGVSWNKIGGTIQNDVLKEYIAQKTWMIPPRPAMRIVSNMIEFCMRNVPKWNTISISGYHIREAGSTAIQELAFTLADGIAYVQAALGAGLNVDEFAPRLSFFFNAHSDFFEEIAKYRAARRMWAKIMKERFSAKNPRSLMLRFHSQTAGCSLTAQQPMNNVVRTAVQALSAILGGTQSLHTNALDETLALPTEESATLALRTQQIIAEETGVINVVDPLGGAYFIEALTDKMEKSAFEYIEKIDRLGGMVAAIEQGYPQREIIEASYHYQKQLEKKEKIIVGVNKYVEAEERPVDILRITREVEEEQCRALTELRSHRNNAAVRKRLAELKKAARGSENVMPYVIAAVREYATEGEICDIFREVFGEYHDPGYV